MDDDEKDESEGGYAKEATSEDIDENDVPLESLPL